MNHRDVKAATGVSLALSFMHPSATFAGFEHKKKFRDPKLISFSSGFKPNKTIQSVKTICGTAQKIRQRSTVGEMSLIPRM